VIIHVSYYICAFCWCIKDIIYEKMHGMESFKIPVNIERNSPFEGHCESV